MTLLVPAMVLVMVSEAVMVCGPAVVSVALKLPAPLVNVLLAGRVVAALPSLLAK